MAHAAARAHAGYRHDDRAAGDAIDRHRFRQLARAVEAGRVAFSAVPQCPSVVAARFLFVQVRRIEHDEPRDLARRRGRDDFAAEAAFEQQRQPAAVIEAA
jgi:hypothetical protein